MDDALKTRVRDIKQSNVETMLLFAPLSKFLATCLTRSIQACKNECLVLSGTFSQMSFVSLFLSL